MLQAAVTAQVWMAGDAGTRSGRAPLQAFEGGGLACLSPCALPFLPATGEGPHMVTYFRSDEGVATAIRLFGQPLLSAAFVISGSGTLLQSSLQGAVVVVDALKLAFTEQHILDTTIY
jgi:cytochrome c biogenesis protein CcdA